MKQAVEINTAPDGQITDLISRHRVKRTAIVIADRRVARIFMDNGRGLEPVAVLEPEPMDFPKSATNQAMGRAVSFCSRFVRHRLEQRKTPGQQEAFDFARRVSGWLDESARGSGFDRLILVAAPAMLGNLRKTMGRHVQNLVCGEAARDLTKIKDRALYDELKKIIRL